MGTRARGGRPPSIVDVAAAAGVSHQTVSRVLNGSDKVSPETRERVRRAIDDLGYRRNSMARALVTRKSGVIGILTTTSLHYGPTSMLLAVELAARRAGYFTGVAPIEESSPEAMRAAVDYFLGLSVEGLVILAPLLDMAEDLAFVDFPVPVVAVTSPVVAEAVGVLSVSVDQAAGAMMAVRHLIGLGHTDIAHVPGPAGWYEAQTREASWRATMEEAGLAVREPLAHGWDAETGYEVGLALARDGAPTAVFCANDDLSLGLIHALHDSGLSVPGDVSVVGFDDVPQARFYLPRLTTVSQDFLELGRRVVSMLLGAMEGREPAGPVALRPELVVRASTTMPRR
ncbi:MAG: LacI family DNA-binding transcriptional regulator [Actinomyces sp.]|jgi:DNA-binding LacI/PurR family transcriptional regulator|nr:LacI family DNA-binding transcriptional regulator [Actinomyces sp.]MCI1787959.1 LacI family DNA-binding transcriptional regulator [Actinomyces sp.]MCI1831287.1 LacI family DNA-binding transcriptional regulator [Actinomyces sp.]MCI1867081.1 LacI family DNA-binding transcriptional regulator [Actinomyces sp.]